MLFSCNVLGHSIQGKVENQKAAGVPILIIQGGPGMPYDYMLPLASLLKNHPVIFYNSVAYYETDDGHIPQELLNFEFSKREIEVIRQDLQLDHLMILGHSAGTLTALEYALSGAQGIESLIFVSPVFSVSYYQQQMQQLLLHFPVQYQQIIKQAIQGVEVDAIDMMEAMAYFYEEHMCRLPQWPEALMESSIKMNKSMLNHLWGANDFLVSGVWKNYEQLHSLSQIKTPTLLVCGEHDFIDIESCNHYARHIVDSKVAEISGASHNPHLEASADLQKCLEQFIKVTYQ